MQIPQIDEDVDHLVVELALGQLGQVEAKQLQPLHRIGGMHRALERQVHVQRLRSMTSAWSTIAASLGCTQRARRCQELR